MILGLKHCHENDDGTEKFTNNAFIRSKEHTYRYVLGYIRAMPLFHRMRAYFVNCIREGSRYLSPYCTVNLLRSPGIDS
jgi:hypothetical protein